MAVALCTPLSVFRGRPVAPGEPLWTDDDRLWALAWRHDRDARMGCGCHPDDTTGSANADRFTVEPQICHRHRAIGEAAESRQREIAEAPHAGTAKHGVMWRTKRVRRS